MDHLLLPHTRLIPWPRQMRRVYDPEALRSLAASQQRRAAAGLAALIQPIVITPGPGQAFDAFDDHAPLYIVAGSRRWKANQLLDPAPLLHCVVRHYPTEAALLADMAEENGQRQDPTASEWGRYYQHRLQDGTSTPKTLAEESGRTANFVRACVDLLDLPPAVQGLFDAGRLPLTVVNDVRRLRHWPVRRLLRQATLWAERGLGVQAIDIAVRQALARENRPAAKKVERLLKPPTAPPALDETPIGPRLPEVAPAQWADLRASAAAQCGACSLGQGRPPELAWRLAAKAARHTCAACTLATDPGACRECPLLEMLTRVLREVGHAPA